MAIVERLQGEHREIRQHLDVFERGVMDLALGKRMGGYELMSSVDGFIEGTMLPHFVLEEKTVLPQLMDGSAQERGLGRELLSEHVGMRDCFVRYFAEASRGKVTEGLLAMGRDICSRLDVHIQKEETVLVPLLRDWMSLTGANLTKTPLVSAMAAPSGSLGQPAPDVSAETLGLLSRSVIFNKLTESQLVPIAALGQWREYPTGETVAREGEVAQTVSVVAEGSLAIVRTVQTEAGPLNFTSALLYPGEVVGWSALVEPHRYSATARCMAPVRCFDVDGASLREVLSADPVVSSQVMASLATVLKGRLRATTRTLVRSL